MSALLSLLLIASAPTVQPAALQPSTETPIPAGKVSSANLGSVVAALQKDGYRAKLVIKDGKAHVESAANGANFYIYQQNCVDNGRCEDLLFRSSYTKKKNKPIGLDGINGFNREIRWVRAYLDNENDPIVEMDVVFTDQLIEEKMFLEAVELWSDSMGKFHTAIDF